MTKTGILHAVWPVTLFLAFTLLMTWPQVLGMGSMLGDPYNNLQAAYLFAEGAKIWTHPADLLNARFFFPHARTMLDNMLMPGAYLISGPVYLMSGNPVLAFNFYLMLHFFLNGWCMYLLARRLLWGVGPAVVSGFVYAFCPFRFSVPQVGGIMATFWACLVLLALHEFVVSGGMRFLPCVIFGFCFGMLFISDISAGLIFSLMVVLFLAWHALRGRLRLRGRTLAGLAAACAIATLMIAPLIMAYVSFGGHRGTGDMTRGIEETQLLSCDLSAFLAAPPTNAMYGWVTKRYRLLIGAQYLFPGIVGGALLVLGLCRRRGSQLARSGEKGFLIVLGVIGVLISFGPAAHFFGRRLCPGPYLLLYYCVPGFKNIRGIGWTVILAMIPFALFCGEGASRLLDGVGRPRTKALLCVALLVGLLTEYFNRNASGDYFTAQNYHVRTTPPEVYVWLKSQKGEFGVLELPMPVNEGEFEDAGYENEYMRWSLYHGKRIVNGYASFRPPEYWPLLDVMAGFPSPETIDVIRALGVRYVIVHAGRYDYNEFERQMLTPGEGRRVVERALRLPEALVPVGHFGSSYVFALAPGAPTRGVEETASVKEILPERAWRITASVNPGAALRILDHDSATVWGTILRNKPPDSSGFSNCGNWLQIDFSRPLEFSRIEIDYRNFRDYPRGLRADISMDGKSWQRVDVPGAYRDLVIRLLRHPQMRRFELNFPPKRARYLRLTQTLTSSWAVSELRLYAPEDAGGIRESAGRAYRPRSAGNSSGSSALYEGTSLR